MNGNPNYYYDLIMTALDGVVSSFSTEYQEIPPEYPHVYMAANFRNPFVTLSNSEEARYVDITVNVYTNGETATADAASITNTIKSALLAKSIFCQNGPQHMPYYSDNRVERQTMRFSGIDL